MKKDEEEYEGLPGEDPEDSKPGISKKLETIPDSSFTEAIDLWCEQYKPTEKNSNADSIKMDEILESLNSLFGFNVEFSGIQVYAELKKRGYKTAFDGASNQFKILVEN